MQQPSGEHPGEDTPRRQAGSDVRALEEQTDALKDCRGCGLHAGRTQVVFGVGNPSADLMFVGEGPGFHEDRQGEPFVGSAGRLLDELLAGIGLSRADVYIANVVKCRPPGNRDPLPDEIEACSAHLREQVQAIRPRIICTLGNFATRLLAETRRGVTAIHGKAKAAEIAEVPVLVFPVFHPAAALYTPANRGVLERDFRKLRVLLERGEEVLDPPGSGGEDQQGSSAGNAAEADPEQLGLW